MFGAGFRLQILGRTTSLFINLDMVELEHGGLKVTLMRNGNLLAPVPCYGLMENVSNLMLYSFILS